MSNKNILRVYPIRITRKKWNIKVYNYHKCSEHCKIKFLHDKEFPDQILITNNQDYKDGKCNNYNKIESAFVRLIDIIDENDELGYYGKLVNADAKVIPDNSFSVSIYYPLSYIFEITINSTNRNGFTLKEVLLYIKYLYEFIYVEEERTSTPETYNLKKICNLCSDKKFNDYVDILKCVQDFDCAICCNEFTTEQESIKLKCKHVFHSECITTWISKSATCPMCRYNILECDKCDGSGIISYQFTGTVIPVDERGMDLNRNPTNGIFGIYDCDFEDLVIESLKYDRIEKRLHINIIS